MSIQSLARSLQFVTATKKAYALTMVTDAAAMPARSFYVHEGAKPLEVVTEIGGERETKNTAHPGDVVVCGPKGERYVVKPRKFLQLYNVVDEVARPRPLPRQVAVVTRADLRKAGIKEDHLEFAAPWGETMLLKAGDVLVRDGTAGYYRVEKAAFAETYTF